MEFGNKKSTKPKKVYVPDTLQTAVKALISSFAGLEIGVKRYEK